MRTAIDTGIARRPSPVDRRSSCLLRPFARPSPQGVEPASGLVGLPPLVLIACLADGTVDRLRKLARRVGDEAQFSFTIGISRSFQPSGRVAVPGPTPSARYPNVASN